MEGKGVVEGGGAHLGSSLPMSVHIRGQLSSSHVCLSSLMRICFHSQVVVFIRARSSSLVCVRFHLQAVTFVWGVAFVRGWSCSFLSICICSWAVVTLATCGGGGGCSSWPGGGCSLWPGGGCSSWPGGGCSLWPGGGCSLWPFMVELRGGGVGWLVVINEDDE